jgi:hypothetical protein
MPQPRFQHKRKCEGANLLFPTLRLLCRRCRGVPLTRISIFSTLLTFSMYGEAVAILIFVRKLFKGTVYILVSSRVICMGKLYLRCKTCGVEFQAGVVFDKKSFEVDALGMNRHTCPGGHTHHYNSEEYYFK